MIAAVVRGKAGLDTLRSNPGTSFVPLPTPTLSPSPLTIPAFRRLLLTQALFGVAYSVFLILPKYLATHLHAATGLISWIMASAAAANVVTAPLIGRIAGGSGARRGMVIGNLSMAAGSILFVFVASPGIGAFVARALQGMGWALVFSSAGMLAVALAPKDRIAQAIGLHGSANIVTNAIGPALAEPAIAAWGATPVFLAAATIALLAAYQATRVSPGGGATLTPEAAAPLATTIASRAKGSAPFMLFTSLMLGVACGVMFTLHQPLALDRGIHRVSDFLVGYTVGALAMRLGFGRLTDQLGPGRVSAGSFVLYGAVIAAMPALRGSVGLAAFGLLFGVAHGIFFPALLALALGSAPDASRARVIAGFNATFNVGGAAVVPFGLLAEKHGFTAAFLPVGLATLATGLAIGGWSRRHPIS
jgi:MFS family permease